MAAKSIINELYQRLRTAAPIYKTQADDTDGFLCTLTLPAVECEFEALSTERTFTGRGCSKKVGALDELVPHTTPYFYQRHNSGILCSNRDRPTAVPWHAAVLPHFTLGHFCLLQEAEHAAAIAGVELLTAEKVLRPDAPTGSHSRGTATASPSVSSATSGVSLPGVGSKRSKSNADPLDEDCAGEQQCFVVQYC